MEGLLDIGKQSGQSSVAFDMPNKDPELARRLKHEWYVKNREELLKRKREQRAAKKKLKPPKPPPTPEEKARSREANRQSCIRYRASHVEQVRYLNRLYYDRNRERIVQQQRDRRARDRQSSESPFRKLRVLADVCAARLLEVEHGYARIEPVPETKEGSREKLVAPKAVSTTDKGIHGRDGMGSVPKPSTLL